MTEWYVEYLKGPHWRSLRQFVLERASHRCQLCSGTRDLSVHHNTYERLGKELPADLIVLCQICHGRHHQVLAPIPAKDPRVVVSSVSKPGKWNVLRNSYRRPA